MTRSLLTAVVLLAGVAFPASAQTPPSTPPSTAAPQAMPSPDTAAISLVPSEKDLGALNFYVQQKDQASVDAELRRLRTQFPAWVPPDDLSKLAITQPSTEIDTIYRQIAASDLTGARATIATTQTQYPAWVPSADMMRLLETEEGQVNLDAALAAGNAAEALQIASSTNGLLRCDRVNNAWRIAQAQEAQQASDLALATYTGIMQACTNFPDILTTLEKSDTVTTDGQLGDLFSLALSRFPDKTADLKALQSRLLAGRGEAPADIALQTGIIAGNGMVPTGTLAPAAPNIHPRPRPTPGSENVAQNSAQTNTGAVDRTTGNSAQGRTMTPEQCLAATANARSAQALAQRGWCAYNLDRPLEALSAFKSAEQHLGSAPRRDARFGMALSYLKLNMTEDASRVAASTDFTHQQRVETESIILNQRGVVAYKQRNYGQSIRYFDALEQMKGTLPRSLALLRGYAYMNSGNVPKAREIFLALNDQLATSATRAALKASTIP
ncbi:MAG: hypothetical protein ACOH2H_25635 [Cypionkella sp.]